MDNDTIERDLPVDLTAAELRERALELSDKIGEGRRLEAERKSAASDYKAKDLALRQRIDELSSAVRGGRENRLIECRWSRNDAFQRMELHRLDSGEVIESRALTPAERQVTMFGAPSIVDAPGEGVRRRPKKASGGEGESGN